MAKQLLITVVCSAGISVVCVLTLKFFDVADAGGIAAGVGAGIGSAIGVILGSKSNTTKEETKGNVKNED